jgi:hypothetical protein
MNAIKSMKGQIDLMGLILVLLLLGFFGVLPFWGYSHSYGYGPGGFVGILLLLVLLRVLKII